MEDFFMSDANCVDRLLEEWKKYGMLIVAFDYDNTVYDYYKKGYTYEKAIELIRDCEKMGFHLTLFTSCGEDRYPEIKEYLGKNNIPYDSINETPDFIPFRGRKVYYNILLDDRAGLSAAYSQLKEVIELIRIEKHHLAHKNDQDVDF